MSYNYGKQDVIHWLKENFNQNDTCLDVGPCDGKWSDLLNGFFKIDAVEIFKPNIDNNHLDEKYNHVFNTDVIDFTYDYYDCIILGDVIEHMTVENAQKVLNYANTHCKDMVIAVPWLFKQGKLYGNPWEVHIQDDLTKKLFEERYPGYEPIWENDFYAYYHKK